MNVRAAFPAEVAFGDAIDIDVFNREPTPVPFSWSPLDHVSVAGSAETEAPELPPASRGRDHVGFPAKSAGRTGKGLTLALSLTVHAAILVAAAHGVLRAGAEVDHDSVNVEILFETPPASIAPSPPPGGAADDLEPSADDGPPTAEGSSPEVTSEEPIEPIQPEHATESPADAQAEIVGPVEAAGKAEPPETSPPAAPVPEQATAPSANAAEPAAVADEKPQTAPVEIADPVASAVPADLESASVSENIDVPEPDRSLMAILAVPPTLPELEKVAPAVQPRQLAEIDAEREERKPAVLKPIERAKQTALPHEAADRARPGKSRATVKKPAKSASKAAATTAEKEPARTGNAKPAPSKSKAGRGGTTPSNAAAPSAGAQAAYGRKLLAHVQRFKRYPQAAQKGGITGVAGLSITIDRSGGLRGAKLVASTGHAVLDTEALAVARRAAPYPPPPDGVGGKTFGFNVSLRFSR
ncbi:protein TonB [Aminobacter lissarensis]|uniref:Protein TonB n=1 Tax=Aminobacter carboxidus TaxID=376165 RepID=A0A8E1WLJ8_9HYPH|nr:TonB family protein [Aminobacter lissarensis]MBB6469392.1 protein TonB [Aminobacter lissarensis]